MKEKELLTRIQLKASALGARLFRNNVGQGWIGKSTFYSVASKVNIRPGDVVIRGARRFHAGLCKGSSDLIGFVPVEITEDMVGQKFAVFLAIEGKTGKDKLRPEQVDFVNLVNNMGGRAVVLRDPELINNEIMGIKVTAGGKT
jgi:hypothetical protein